MTLSTSPEALGVGAQPVVSVVVATHKRPELLKLAIAAILAQDYGGEIEAVVVFDQAEPDMDLVQPVSGAQVRSVNVITNSRTPGLAGARNSGIGEARGDLVAFCDDDDEWLQGKVRAQVLQFNDPDVLTSVTGIRITYSDHEVVRIPTTESLSIQTLARRRVMEAHPSTVMVRRDALLGTIGLVDEEIPGSYGEDFDWLIRAARAGRIAVVEREMVRVRWGQSLFSRNWQSIVDAIDYLLAKHEELRADRKGKARLLGRRSFALAAMGRRKEAIDQAFETVRLAPGERRAYLAIAVALRVVTAEQLLNMAHKRGRGI